MAVLERRYRVRLGEQIFARQGYLAGSDDIRADEFNGLLRDPDVRAIIMARSGYGAMRILPRLDADALRADPKLLVGFSDATAILAWALTQAGVRALHGPVVSQMGILPADDIDWLFKLMEQPGPLGNLPGTLTATGYQAAAGTAASPAVGPIVGPVVRPIEGTLVGGNLCVLAHLVGTPYEFAEPEQIVFFEEVGERPYRIDRFLTQLGLAGLTERTVAALVGELTRCHETVREGHPSAEQVVDERLRHLAIPGLIGAPLAHGERHLAVPIGGRCVFDQRAGVLSLLDGAVS